MFDYWVSDKMEFSAEDKRACFETAKTVVAMADKVRKGGILALEEDIESMDSAFLKAATLMTVDGIHHDELKKVLENWIISGNYRGKELFNRILIMDGMLALQQGCNPTFIRESSLGSLFGEDLTREYTEYMKTNEVKINVEEKFWEKIRGEQSSESLGEFEKIGKFDDMAMQILIREINSYDIIVAFQGLPENIVRRFLDDMSRRSAEHIMNSCVMGRTFRQVEVDEARKRIWDKVMELEKSGQIRLPK